MNEPINKPFKDKRKFVFNRLAGEDLLIWESRRGGVATGPIWLWESVTSKKQIPMNALASETKTSASLCHSINQLAADKNDREKT
jgi:hypothetical protein